LCTYDVGQFAAFESGLIMVDNALIGTTEFDIFSINPATCAENWRTHEDYPPSLLPANRGAAYMDGMLFRGTQDGRVLAYDFKTGKRIWQTTIADAKRGESVPSAPIAWDDLVFVGNAGGDYKGGKGRMYALDAKTGKIVWEFFLVPRAEGEVTRGPHAAQHVDLEKRDRYTHQWRRDLDVIHYRSENRASVRACLCSIGSSVWIAAVRQRGFCVFSGACVCFGLLGLRPFNSRSVAQSGSAPRSGRGGR
jgi:PQQ-like domain/PQQ enzyme repeat